MIRDMGDELLSRLPEPVVDDTEWTSMVTLAARPTVSAQSEGVLPLAA